MLVLQYCRNANSPCIFLCMSDYISGLQREEEFAVPYLGDSFLQMEGSGKGRIGELMVVSPSSLSMSDPNHLMSLEVKQYVVIFLLFILPLQANKTKEVKLKLWRASLTPFLCASVILFDCSSSSS